MNNRQVGALTLSLIVFALCGCTGSRPSTTDGSDDVAAMFTKNIDRWAMPLDSFEANLGDKSSIAYGLVIRRCLAQSDISYPLPADADYSSETATQNTWERPLFTVELAQAWGYTKDLDIPQAELETFRAEAEAAYASVPETFTECQNQASLAVRFDDAGLTVNGRGLGGVAYEDALADAEVVRAADEWRECMAPLGIPDLPDRPEHMPTESMLTRFGMPTSMDSGPGEFPPSADQLAIAVTDAECRASSGYTESLYNAEWDHEIAIVAENLTALQRNHVAFDAWDRQLDEIIAQNGG